MPAPTGRGSATPVSAGHSGGGGDDVDGGVGEELRHQVVPGGTPAHRECPTPLRSGARARGDPGRPDGADARLRAVRRWAGVCCGRSAVGARPRRTGPAATRRATPGRRRPRRSAPRWWYASTGEAPLFGSCSTPRPGPRPSNLRRQRRHPAPGYRPLEADRGLAARHHLPGTATRSRRRSRGRTFCRDARTAVRLHGLGA